MVWFGIQDNWNIRHVLEMQLNWIFNWLDNFLNSFLISVTPHNIQQSSYLPQNYSKHPNLILYTQVKSNKTNAISQSWFLYWSTLSEDIPNGFFFMRTWIWHTRVYAHGSQWKRRFRKILLLSQNLHLIMVWMSNPIVPLGCCGQLGCAVVGNKILNAQAIRIREFK